MNSLLIASFKDESSARSAMKKMDDLALNGTIDLYERTLIRKRPGGRTEVFKEGGSAGWHTISAALAGSAVGLLGGPFGFVIGLVAGALVGSAVSDREQHDFGREIKNIVENEIPPGKVAIVAHLGEKGPDMVDSVLERFDSRPFRTDLRKYQGGTAINKIS